jgi:hypothetical protein
MEVKKITKTVEEVVGYVAFDGTEFKDKDECCKYEGTAEAVIKRGFIKNCVKFMHEESEAAISGDGYFCAGCGEDCYDAVVFIKNEEDLKYAQMFQEITCDHNAKRKFTVNDIGKKLLVYIGYRDYKTDNVNYDYCHIYGTLEDIVEEFRYAVYRMFLAPEDKTTE